MNFKRLTKILLWILMASAIGGFLLPSGSLDAQSQSNVENLVRRRAQTLGNSVTSEAINQSMRSKAETLSGLEEEVADANEMEIQEPNEAEAKPLETAERSSIELLLAGKTSDKIPKDLIQFGYNVFTGSKSKYDPVRNVPVGQDYVVGPGDSFTVTMWGRHTDRISVVVDRDGKIALPEVGALIVSGMSFGQLQDYLETELQRKFTDFRMHITMGRLRTMTVYVTGEAAIPGSHTLSSLGTVIHALFAAGGPTKNGTLRNVRLLRLGQEPKSIDLYDFLMGGDQSADIRLLDGDTIHIPLIGHVVGIAGNVKRPAIYEMKELLTLTQVLDLAGGINYAGWQQRVQIERVENHRRRIVEDFDLSQSTVNNELETSIQDGDMIKVFSVLDIEENVVYLEGHVVRPSKYELKPDMTIKDILDSYNLFLPQVNIEHAEIERLVPPDLHPIIIPFNLGKVLDGDESQNFKLAQFDRIRLFRWDEKGKTSVYIDGMVYDPNEYQFIPGMRVKDLIDAAGGLHKNAYVTKAELTRRHISQSGMATETIEINLENALTGDQEQNIRLQDYDHLVVRPISELDFDRTVAITGEVKFPGIYPIHKGERLSSLIERAGGYTLDAYLKGAVFTRESAKQVQQKRMDDLIQQLEDSLLNRSSQAAAGALDSEGVQIQQAQLDSKQALIDKFESLEVDGRVVIKLRPLDEFKEEKYDIVLEAGDELDIPKTPGIVNLIGEVYNPTALIYEENQSVEYYLSRVGGMKKDADKKYVSVIRADGSVVSMAQKGINRIAWDQDTHQWQYGGFMNLKLDPGDTIIVPAKLDKLAVLKTTKDLTQILFQIAVAAGVVLAL